MVDGTLYITSPDNAWALDARRPRDLALLLALQGAPIANRGVGHVEHFLLHGDARQLPDLARREDRQGALEQGPRTFNQQYFLDRPRQSSSTTT